VVVSKYVDHTPLHRLSGIFAREGLDLPRSTLCDWIADVATARAPIGDQLQREIAATDYLQTDDTTITVLDERGGSYKGRLWTYLDPLARQVVFDATPTHERDGPAAFLAAFRGKLQADAYSGYDGLYQGGRVLEIGCWAHARRGFVEAFLIDTAAALMIALIKQLYDVERDAVDVDPERLEIVEELRKTIVEGQAGAQLVQLPIRQILQRPPRCGFIEDQVQIGKRIIPAISDEFGDTTTPKVHGIDPVHFYEASCRVVG
jgi:hypothetical protein